MRKNIPITNKFKQTFNIFRKGCTRTFVLPNRFITHSSRNVRFKILKKVIFLTMFSVIKNQQNCYIDIIKNKPITALPLIFCLRKPLEKYRSINSEEIFRKSRKLTLRLYAACSKNAYISFAELEAARRAIKRVSKRALKNKIFLRAYPFLYLTRKPSEVRMGKGKGVKLRDKVCPVHAGKVLFELRQVSKRIGIYALSLAQQKLSIPTHIVKKVYTAKSRKLRMYRTYNI